MLQMKHLTDKYICVSPNNSYILTVVIDEKN